MYDKLVKDLREKAEFLSFAEPLHIKSALAETMKQAADALEELVCDLADEHNARLDAEERRCWIPVSERLPQGGDKSGQICVNVLLYFDDGNVYPGWMNGCSEKVYYLDDDNDYVLRAPISRVKMWQPLPEPPKEGKV